MNGISITQRDDVPVHRIELLHTGRHESLLEQLVSDIASTSPETTVNPCQLSIADPWDFGDVYGALFDFARAYPFNPEEEEYWIHITTGTHVAQICMFLLAEARYFPGVLLQTSPPQRERGLAQGSHTLIDLDLSRYDQLSTRFAREQADAITFLKSGIATRNARFNVVVEEIERVAVR